MKKFYFSGRIVTILIFVFLLIATAAEISVFAQRTRPTSVERRTDELNRQILEEERNRLYRDLKSGKSRTTDRVVSPAKIEQIKKDFAEMQNGYNQIVVEMTSKQSLNFDGITAALKEIHHCAARLKENLILPEAQNDEKKAAEPNKDETAELEKTLLTLRKHIYNFVTNPLFETQGTLDIELASRASGDLDKIIEISESVRKNGSKSKKTPHR